ncbi:MAG: cation:proton antiporter [Rhodospirillales bacterium]
MDHGSDLTGIALVFSVAVISGLVLTRLRQPAIVGYILAGIALGGDGFGLIQKTEQINTLAELGVIMLVFLIGMELSLRTFVSVLRIAVPCTLLQIAASVGFAVGLAFLAGKSWQTGIVFGFIISLSSTAVAIKMLADLGELRTDVGRVTVGVLIAQDLAVVPMLIVINALKIRGGGLDQVVLLKLVGAVLVIIAFIWFLSRRHRLVLPTHRWLKGQSDLIPLAAVAFCFSAAAASGAAGLSTAFGAFLAGLLIGNSTDRAVAVRATLPIQSILMVVFFLSVGLLLDLDYLEKFFLTVIGWLALIVVVKTIINIAVLHLLGEPWDRAFPAGVIMGQIGEFSFVLCTVGAASGLLTRDDKRLAIAVIALSLLVSPLWQLTVRRFHDAAAEGITGLRATLKKAYEQELGFAGRTAFVVRNGTAVLIRTARQPGRLRRRPR